MMFKLRIVNFISSKLKSVRKSISMSGYNDETIVSYFRTQGARIGEHCRIQIRRIASEPYLVNIGNHVAISAGAVLHTHDGGAWILKDKIPEIDNFGTITIEDNCIIGVNAQILPNVRIGSNSIVGAGSVVITDVPPNSIAMGVPARVIGSVLKYQEKCLSKWKEQRSPNLRTKEGYDYWLIEGNQEILRRHLTKYFDEQSKPREETGK